MNIERYKTFESLDAASDHPQKMSVIFRDTKCTEFIIGRLVRANNGTITLYPLSAKQLNCLLDKEYAPHTRDRVLNIWNQFNLKDDADTGPANRITSDWYLFQVISEMPSFAGEKYIESMQTFLEELARRTSDWKESMRTLDPPHVPDGPGMMRAIAAPACRLENALVEELEVPGVVEEEEQKEEVPPPQKRKAVASLSQPSKRQEIESPVGFLSRIHDDIKANYALHRKHILLKGVETYIWKEPVSLAFLATKSSQFTNEEKRSALLITAVMSIEHHRTPLNIEDTPMPEFKCESLLIPKLDDMSPRKLKKLVKSVAARAEEIKIACSTWDAAYQSRESTMNDILSLLQSPAMTLDVWCSKLSTINVLPLVSRLMKFFNTEFAGSSFKEWSVVPSRATGAAILVHYHNTMEPESPSESNIYF